MFGLPGMDEIEKQVDGLFSGVNAQLTRIEENQKAIMAKLGMIPENNPVGNQSCKTKM